MSALETAAGEPFGFEPPQIMPATELSPMAALEEVVATAVRNGPCCVAFSGGRDSSLVLAAAVHAARAQGAPQPTPLTVRYPTIPEAQEATWQELVLGHLDVQSQVIIDITHELDFVGPVATAQLLKHGVLFPPNSHNLVSLLPSAAGGTLLLGIGGDELFGSRYWREFHDLLAGRRRLQLHDARRLALPLVPGSLRGARVARRRRHDRPWLRTEAARSVRAHERRSYNQPLRYDRSIEREARSRALAVGLASLRHLGKAHNVRIEAPLLDRRFVAALAQAGGAWGWGNRHATMQAIANGYLPDALLVRADKAVFTGTHVGDHTRRFAEGWSGGGVDTGLVDPDALRQVWLSPEPDVRSALLLQLAWIHDHGLGARSKEAAPTEEPAMAAT